MSNHSIPGKTESSKIVLHYLVSRASAIDTNQPLPAYGSVTSHGEGIESRLLQTSPILEAFGNAKSK
jgi:myosin heavy subunit